MITFDQFWQALYNHGATLYHKAECFDLWNTITPAQQQQLHNIITTKIRERRFVDYNPLRAMRDNLRQLTPQQAPTQPTNLNGTARGGRMLERGQAAIALYNGQAGIYTLEDIRLYNLQRKN